MHTLGVTAAALQFTRWKSGDPRSEWIVYNRDGHARFSCFSWGKPVNNKMLGVQLLVSHRLLQSVCIHTRFDPPRSLHGRLGGLRITSRTKGVEMDDLFVTAYAPQESDEEQRPLFFQALMEILHSVPKRTRVWLLGDFNGHVGHNSRSTAVGPQATDVTNNNGMSLVHACESAGLWFANTYSGWGPTCWTPDGRHSHCIDFIAVPLEFRSRVRRCRVNKVLGKRWQMSPVRDHWPVEVVVALPKPWTLLKGSTQTVRWNKHALQVALDHVSVGNKFFRECEQASHDVPRSLPDRPSREEVEHHWQHLQSELHQVAVRHFSMRPSQKSCKILFALLNRSVCLTTLKASLKVGVPTISGGRLLGFSVCSSYRSDTLAFELQPSLRLSAMRKHGSASLTQSFNGHWRCMIDVKLGPSVGSWLDMDRAKCTTELSPPHA